MIVADASAIVVAVADTAPRNDAALERFTGGAIAPHLVDAEVGHAIRGLALRGLLLAEEAVAALVEGYRLVSARAEHGPLMGRAWDLRDNLTFYDALYVALAEAQQLTLVTADARLAAAPGPRCRIEVV